MSIPGSCLTLKPRLQFLVLCDADKLLPLGIGSPVRLRLEPLRRQRERNEEVVEEFLLEYEGADYVDRYARKEPATVAKVRLAKCTGQTAWGVFHNVLDLCPGRLVSLFEPDTLDDNCLSTRYLRARLALGYLLR